jgi:hypothetical protein
MAGVAAATAVAYYRIERERRLEEAMGKVVSSESGGMWTPRPDYLAKRKFVQTKDGWFPVDDVSGGVANRGFGVVVEVLVALGFCKPSKTLDCSFFNVCTMQAFGARELPL